MVFIMALVDIPLVAVGDFPAIARQERERCLAVKRSSTFGVPDFLLSIPDRISRWWLRRQGNPYLAEMDSIRQEVGAGVYLLNSSYEWGCTTSAVGGVLRRTLDWLYHGLGRHVVVAKQESGFGPWYHVTWPGSVGVLTALCPGRFAIAINQAPLALTSSWLPVNHLAALGRVAMMRDAIPIMHLVRQICEHCADLDQALARLADPAVTIPKPAFVTLAGQRGGQPYGVVVERLAGSRGDHRCHDSCPIVANDWLSSDLTGFPRGHGRTRRHLTADNRARRESLRRFLDQQDSGSAVADPFAWVTPPVRNSLTRLAVVMDSQAGTLSLIGYERDPGNHHDVVPVTRVFQL